MKMLPPTMLDEELPASIRKALDDLSEAANMPTVLGPPHQGESLSDLHERL